MAVWLCMLQSTAAERVRTVLGEGVSAGASAAPVKERMMLVICSKFFVMPLAAPAQRVLAEQVQPVGSAAQRCLSTHLAL